MRNLKLALNFLSRMYGRGFSLYRGCLLRLESLGKITVSVVGGGGRGWRNDFHLFVENQS